MANVQNNKVVVIGSRNNRLCRISYNPVTGTDKNKMVAAVENAGDVACLQAVNYTLGQFIEQGFDGKVQFVIHDDVAVRAFEHRKAINAGQDAVTVMIKDWMEEDYIAMIEEFCAAMDECKAEIQFTKLKNLHKWDLKVAGEFVPVTDENKHLIGTKLNFVDGVSGEFTAQHGYIRGDYEVTTHMERVGKERVEVLALVRPCSDNNTDLINMRKAEDAVWKNCPKPVIDFDDIEESEAV